MHGFLIVVLDNLFLHPERVAAHCTKSTGQETWTATGAGSNTWKYADSSNNVCGVTLAQALWALYKLEGYSTQVADVYAYVRGLAANAAFLADTNEYSDSYTPPATAYVGGYGTFNPKLALSTHINVTNANNGAASYAWATMGLLAEIQATRDPSSLATAKTKFAALSANHQVFTGAAGYSTQTRPQPINQCVYLRGRSGLDGQQAFGFTTHQLLPQDSNYVEIPTSTASDAAQGPAPLTYNDEIAMAALAFRFNGLAGQVY